MEDIRDPELFQNVLEGLRIGVFLLDKQGKIFFWNDGAEAIAGYHRHEVLGHFCQDNILDECKNTTCGLCNTFCPFVSTLQDGKVQELRIQLHHKAGHRTPVRICVTPIRNSRGVVIGSAQSFDEQKFAFDRDRRQHNLSAYGCLDYITGLPNHSFTEFHFRENLASFLTYHLPFGILRVRVDQFPQFRSRYGPDACDAILRVVAQTMRNSIRPSDFLGRWMEDEFLVILPNCSDRGVRIAAERIGRLVSSAGLQWWGDKHQITTQMGHAAAQTGDTMESLLARGEAALRQVPASRAAAASGSAAQERPKS